MLKILMSFLMLVISFFMMYLTHPLSMGLMILIQTLLICLISGMIIKTYWFSYILFLTFLGGLLVLFIYVSSIASNELFSSINFNMKIYFTLCFFFMMFMQYFFFNNLNWMNLSNNMMESENFFFNYLFFNNENKININKLYNNHNFMLMLMMMIYLFISLIAIVKITNIYFGPLRTI